MKGEIKVPDGTPEEKEIYLKLIKKFGLKIAKTIDPIPGEVKVIKDECFCSLCETTTVTYIKLIKYTDGVWKKDCILAEDDIQDLPVCIREDIVSTCPCCMDFLMAKDKEELAKIILRTRSPVLTNKAVKKVLEEMRRLKGEMEDVDSSDS